MINTQLTDLCMTHLPELVDLILDEHEHQIEKWGKQTCTPWEWLGYTLEELGEVSKAISEHEYLDGTTSSIIHEAVQAATLCLKIAEMYLEVQKQEGFTDHA